MENENTYRQEKIRKYRSAMGDLFRYIPWFEQRVGGKAVSYRGDNGPGNSIAVPVYDGTLLAFVKEMQGTGLVDRNYVYTYSHYKLRSAQDELEVIEQADLREIEAVFAIMAKYVLGGMTKGALWSEAVENGVFFHGLVRIKELLDIWDQPLA